MLDVFSHSKKPKKTKSNFADLFVGKKIVNVEGRIDATGQITSGQLLVLHFDNGDVIKMVFERIRFSFKDSKERIKEINTEILEISKRREHLCKELNRLCQ